MGCVSETLDVRNAFNSPKWVDMIEALEKHFYAPSYLSQILRNNLRSRALVYGTQGGDQEYRPHWGWFRDLSLLWTFDTSYMMICGE